MKSSFPIVSKGHSMTSIMTNNSATVALQALRGINREMEASQSRIATGHKVDSAKDNAAIFSVATTMRSDVKSLNTVGSMLGVGQAKVDVAGAGTDSAISTITKMKELLVSAKETGADKVKVQGQIAALQSQLVSTAQSASFDGVNMLYKAATGTASAAVQNITASIGRDASGGVNTTTISVDTADTMLIDAGTAANGILSQSRTGTNSGSYSVAGGSANIALTSSTTSAQLDDMIEAVTSALADMSESSSMLGTVSAGIDSQGDFVKALTASLNKGISSLVDTDMEEESAKLTALQARQQLAVHALSIANDNSSYILQLFR